MIDFVSGVLCAGEADKGAEGIGPQAGKEGGGGEGEGTEKSGALYLTWGTRSHDVGLGKEGQRILFFFF